MIGTIDPVGRTSDGYREFVESGRKVWAARSLGDLRNDGAKDWIARCKCDAAFNLDFEDGRIPARVVSMHDNVVERMPLGRPLQLHEIDSGAGQTARFRACQ